MYRRSLDSNGSQPNFLIKFNLIFRKMWGEVIPNNNIAVIFP